MSLGVHTRCLGPLHCYCSVWSNILAARFVPLTSSYVSCPVMAAQANFIAPNRMVTCR